MATFGDRHAADEYRLFSRSLRSRVAGEIVLVDQSVADAHRPKLNNFRTCLALQEGLRSMIMSRSYYLYVKLDFTKCYACCTSTRNVLLLVRNRDNTVTRYKKNAEKA